MSRAALLRWTKKIKILFYTSGGPYVSLFYIKVVVACGGVNYFIYIIYIYYTCDQETKLEKKETEKLHVS